MQHNGSSPNAFSLRLAVLLLAALIVPGVANGGGVSVGNGGDSVECVRSNVNSLNGIYALDYLMTLDAAGFSNAKPVASWQESKTRIRKLLADNYPAMLPSFDAFLSELGNNSDWTRKRIWLASPHGLIDIHDEQFRRKLPLNCGQSTATGNVSLIQTVVRNKQPKIVQYEFDAQSLIVLSKVPLQYSFLLIHEWLWDHTDDPQIIRWANQFLHSDKAEALSPEQFQVSLNNIGISSLFNGFWSVCDRTPEIREAIELSTGKSCQNIEIKDLDIIKTISLNTWGSSAELQVNDLNGMGRLKTFHLYNSTVKSIPPEYFRAAQALEGVTLAIPLASLDTGLLKHNPSARSIGFKGFELSGLPENLLANLPMHIEQIGFVGPNLVDLPEKFFSYIQNKNCHIDFRGTKFLEPAKIKQQAAQYGIKRLAL